MTYCLIDPPLPFDSIDEWREHLARLQELATSNPEVQDDVAHAEWIISFAKRNGKLNVCHYLFNQWRL